MIYYLILFMNTPRSSANSVKTTHVLLYAGVLAALSVILSPKNPHDPTGQSGFTLRGTAALINNEAAKAGLPMAPSNQNTGWHPGLSVGGK